ncbi:MAG: amidohydrolase family protein [Pirellulaceae bacterium]
MQKLDRRELLGGVVAGAAVGLTSTATARETASDKLPPWRAIDTNVSLFHWPFRRLPLDETGRLVQKLKSHAMEQAWAGSFEGLLHLDLAGVNSRLATACREQGDGLLIPFGSVNPTVPDWEEDLRRCHEEHKMPGIRLHPNYHGYSLDDPRFERLMRLAAKREIVVQLAATMEDGRTQHRMLQVADVDLAPLPDLVKRVPGTRLVVLNHKGTGPEFMQLLKIPGVYFDMSRVNATDGVARVIRTLPTGRIVFGTHAPFLIYESAMIKVEESNLTEDETTSILHRNATRLISRDAS